MNDGFGCEQEHAEDRSVSVRNVSVGRSIMTPTSTMPIMMKERWVATSAPDSTR